MSQGSAVKCLIVDDRDENLLALSALLKSDEVEVLAARSGVEALELLLVHDVALAFLDVQMPQMDGFELAELIRGSERTRHVPLIFMTAGDRDPLRQFRGYDSGAVDFLWKPIDPHILRNKADVFFQLHRQKRQLADELRARTDMLRLNELFVAMLGHDLRNPLTAIVAGATRLQRRSEDEFVRQTADRILDGGKRMGRMIDALLDLTRARLAGGIPLRRGPSDLGLLVDAVVADARTAAPDRAIDLQRHGDLTGNWDGDRLAQVASNLVGNALNHGDPATPVQVQVDGDGAEVVMCVVNGGRIEAELRPSLFDPFRRGRVPAQGLGDGLGLGLYIVQQIALAHGGSIEVNDVEPHSTAFTVRLPRGR